ncbi:hypothetical protein [Mycolicibacterium sphagni]|uniref:hypothetical protein n=1 Tax=Mycolicibacterium sphagni TaxID=1786 RepID=UPI0021F30838|nr:hypothetical protein [Mycolicibacterium sphagni]MCV7176760.1 hypothetical protein [Mycolicibacterium sphagni]
MDGGVYEIPNFLALEALDEIPYPIRAAVLALIDEHQIGVRHHYAIERDNVLARDDLPAVIDALVQIAAAGFAEYYSGNCGTDWESARLIVQRERRLAEELAEDDIAGMIAEMGAG